MSFSISEISQVQICFSPLMSDMLVNTRSKEVLVKGDTLPPYITADSASTLICTALFPGLIVLTNKRNITLE